MEPKQKIRKKQSSIYKKHDSNDIKIEKIASEMKKLNKEIIKLKKICMWSIIVISYYLINKIAW